MTPKQKTKIGQLYTFDKNAFIIYYTWCGMFNLRGGRACPVLARKYNQIFFVLGLFLTTFFTNHTISQTVIFGNPITGTNPSTSNPYTIGQVVNANISVSGIGRGPGIGANAANDRYNCNTWNSPTLDLNRYFSWTMTPNSGFVINFSSFSFRLQRSDASINSFSLRSSVDNFATAIGVVSMSTTGAPGDSINVSLLAPTFQNIGSSIEFRLFAFGANGTNRTLSVNNFNFYGTIGSCTPPSITINPLGTQTLCLNDTPTNLTIIASGTSLTYQWFSNNINSNSGGTLIPTATTNTYSPPTNLSGTVYYYCEVSGACTPLASSSTAAVIINQNPSTSNAGPDQTGSSTCGLTTITLAGNTSVVGTGLWTSSGGGSFSDATSPTSTFTGTAGSTYTLTWTISNAPCTASSDDVLITFNQNPSTSNAGPDQIGLSTCGLTTVTLAGNTPTVGTGLWTSSGGGTFSDATSPTSTFTGTAGSSYTLTWTITNAPCTASSDDVVITFNQNPTTANAGPDQTGASTCGLTTVTLAGNTPTVGTGLWTSSGSGSFGDAASPTSTFTGAAGSSYTLTWTITNAPCTASSDNVMITFNQNPTTANAGPDQTGASTCGLTTVTLAGNTPTVGTGLWTSSGGGSFGDATSPTSTFTGTSGSSYTLTWTISNSPCSASSDDVVITFNQNPSTSNAGPDQTGLSTCGLTTVTLAGNTPTVGTGLWTSSGGGTFSDTTSPTSTFTGTAGSSYTLTWTISNSPCTASSDDVVITFNQSPTTSNAGPDQTGASTCGLTTVTLAGNTPTVGTGLWTSSGGGSFGDATSPTSTFTGTTGSSYTLTWTISNSPCTASSDDVVITFNQNPTATASSNSPICSGSTLNLNSNSGFASYSWSGPGFSSSDEDPSIINATVAATGTYIVQVTDSNGCNDTESTEVVVNAVPTVNITGDNNLCFGESTTLTAVTSGIGNTFMWNTIPLQTVSIITVIPNVTTTYVVTVTNSNNCSSTAFITVTVNPIPIVTFTGSLPTQCNTSTSYILTGGSPSGGTYSGPGVAGNNFDASAAGIGIHTLTYAFTNIHGCSNSATNTIEVINSASLNVNVSASSSPICYSTTAEFNLTGPNNALVTYNLNGNTNQTILLNGSGAATISLNNQIEDVTINLVEVTSGCTASLSGNNTIDVIEIPNLINNGDLTLAANWEGSCPPDSNTPSGTEIQIDHDATYSGNLFNFPVDLIIDLGHSLTNNGTINLQGRSLINNGTFNGAGSHNVLGNFINNGTINP